jgi:hypothetical protein
LLLTISTAISSTSITQTSRPNSASASRSQAFATAPQRIPSVAKQVPFRELCGEFGISRKTGYKWLERFHERGFDGLVDGSHRPKTLPERTSSETTLEIIRLATAASDVGREEDSQASLEAATAGDTVAVGPHHHAHLGTAAFTPAEEAAASPDRPGLDAADAA